MLQKDRPHTTSRASFEEACRHTEAKIREVRQLLLDARPEAVERCQSELQQVVAVLEGLVSEGACSPDTAASAALLGIQGSARTLRLQIEYASNLCFGWIQLRLGAGYTQQGLPLLATGEQGRSFDA
jgi:hypothetical protein